MPNPLYDSFVATPDSCFDDITYEKFSLNEIGMCDQGQTLFNSGGEEPDQYIINSIFSDENKREVDEYSIFISDKFSLNNLSIADKFSFLKDES